MAQGAHWTGPQQQFLADELVRNEAELQRIVDLTPHVSFVLNARAEVIYANRGALEYTGLSEDEVRSGGFRRRAIHPDDVEQHQDYLDRYLSAGLPFEIEERILRADGKYRWFLIRYNPLKDDAGGVLRWYVNGTDIDNRKQIETLRAAEKRAVEMIGDGSTLEDVLNHLCSSIDAQISPSITTILLMDPDGTKLWPAAGPNVSSAWTRAITPLPVCADIGLCGTAAFLKERVVVPDVSTEPNWRRVP